MPALNKPISANGRLSTLEVKVGDLFIGNGHPIRVQTMTTTDTMDTIATVDQAIRCIHAGAELVRITAPSIKEAENLLLIRDELRKKGYRTPLVADIHFTPNAAEVAARIVEKVRVNPGNYADKKKFETITYSDAAYAEEIERIQERFIPLVKICKTYGTALRIGTNHGSLSDRIMSRYGDTPVGMVESAMEFLRIAEDWNYYNIVLSMKASNPRVMVEAYRLLVDTMYRELGHIYPLHLGVTEAGDGEDGRIKSAIGIGTLLEEGIGDTIRVSLTEDPEYELPICQAIVKRYNGVRETGDRIAINTPATYQRRKSLAIGNCGGKQPPIVVADLSRWKDIRPEDLAAIGYTYEAATDKWSIADVAADYIYTGGQAPDFPLPGTLRVLVNYECWKSLQDQKNYVPYLLAEDYGEIRFSDAGSSIPILVANINDSRTLSKARELFDHLDEREITLPVILKSESTGLTDEERLIQHSIRTGSLLLDGMGDGIWLPPLALSYPEVAKANSIAFGILQATRTRISRTEYISCPSCGRTLFDLQEITARIRKVTHHLKGVKIAIMGCIVNGPGEMADADFGYVGSGVGKVSLYKGKDIVKRGLSSEVAVDELIRLIRDSDQWTDNLI